MTGNVKSKDSRKDGVRTSIRSSESRLKQLAAQYPNGREMTRSQRIRAFYQIGSLLPPASKKADHGKAYKHYVFVSFIKEWNQANGLRLSETNTKHIRQFASTFTEEEAEHLIAGGVLWTDLREILQDQDLILRLKRSVAKFHDDKIRPRVLRQRVKNMLEGSSSPARELKTPEVRLARMKKRLIQAIEAVGQFQIAAAAVLQDGRKQDVARGISKLNKRIRKCVKLLD